MVPTYISHIKWRFFIIFDNFRPTLHPIDRFMAPIQIKPVTSML